MDGCNLWSLEIDIKDSGQREQFEGGAVRDVQEDKPRPDLICPFFLRRLGAHLAKGAKKYSARNWELGMPQSRVEASLWRHVVAYMAGEDDEDHLAAAAFNVMMLISQEERFKNGQLPRLVLDDGPGRRGNPGTSTKAQEAEGVPNWPYHGKPNLR